MRILTKLFALLRALGTAASYFDAWWWLALISHFSAAPRLPSGLAHPANFVVGASAPIIVSGTMHRAERVLDA